MLDGIGIELPELPGGEDLLHESKIGCKSLDFGLLGLPLPFTIYCP